MKRLKTMLALILALSMLTTGALAAVTGLDEALSPYLDLNQDVRFSLSYKLKTLLPFGEDMTAMLNGVLGHVTVASEIAGDNTTMTMKADGQTVMTMEEKQENGGFTLTTSLLPNRTLTGTGDGFNALFGEEETERLFSLNDALTEVKGKYQALTDAIVPYATEKKANYKIEGVGYGKWVRLAKLTAEQGAEVAPKIIAVLGCGMDAAFRQELQSLTCKNGFTIALYKTAEDGDDLSVYMKGNVSMGENDDRTLNYQWAFSEAESKQTYKLELQKKKSPVNSRMIKSSLSAKNAGGKLTVSVDNAVTIRNAEGTFATTEKHRLKGAYSDTKTTIAGTMSTVEKTTIDGDTAVVTTTMAPDLTLTSAEGSGVLSGSIALTDKLGNNTMRKEYTLNFDDDPAHALSSAAEDGTLYAVNDDDGADDVTITIAGSSLAQNVEEVQSTGSTGSAGSPGGGFAVGQPPIGTKTFTAPATMQTVDLGSITAEEKQALQDEMSQNMAGVLLKLLATLPDEDSALLKDNMTDEDFATFINMLSGL